MREVSHFIGGERVAGTSGRFGDIYNPNTGEVQARVQLAADAEVAAAIENAKAARRASHSLTANKMAHF
ncbi:MAG: methylmalonate-semialdehyde dehydrogenase (CoA acylating), partial [Pseudomonadota bacterium]